MNSPLISIIVIGRNEAKNLRRLTASLAPLQDRWTSETIFVDSASSDDSVAVARALFDTTAVLAESPRLNASAGRFAGVLLAHGEWALFLDGDMEFTPQCLPQLAAHLEREPRDCGALGTYVHRYTSGAVRRWTATVDRHQRVDLFVRVDAWIPILLS